MLSDAIRIFASIQTSDYPFAQMYFGSMFLILLCVEASVERFVDRHFGEEANIFHSNHGHADAGRDGHNDNDESNRSSKNSEPSDSGHRPDNTTNDDRCASSDVFVDANFVLDEPRPRNAEGDVEVCDNCQNPSVDGGKGSRELVHRRSNWAMSARRPTALKFTASFADDDDDMQLDLPCSGDGAKPLERRASVASLTPSEEQQSINPWVSILLTFVLSIHVVLEGLTLGSSEDVAEIESTFIAIVIHKAFAGFSLGSSLIVSGYWMRENRRMFFILGGVYVAMDVLGLGIGMALASTFDDDGMPMAVLFSLLGGSFLFVSTIELIPGELERARAFKLNLFPILGALLLGYSLMSLIGRYV